MKFELQMLHNNVAVFGWPGAFTSTHHAATTNKVLSEESDAPLTVPPCCFACNSCCTASSATSSPGMRTGTPGG